MSTPFDSLWIEKYRPKTLDDIVLSTSNRELLGKFKEQQAIPHILLAGSAGIGKTSLAKILVNEVLQCQYLYINASDRNGIDDIRSSVIPFAQSMSFDGKMKIVILDECHGLSEQSQDALRGVMEEYAENVRFILTCNYLYKIKDPILSRCQTIKLSYDKKEYFQRLLKIIDLENVEIPSKDELKKLKALFEKVFPNIRTAIGLLQNSVIKGKLSVCNLNDSTFAESVHKMISTVSFYDLREYVNVSEAQFSSDYGFLFKSLLEVVYSCKELPDNKKIQIILLITDHLYKHEFVQDKEVNFFGCMLRVREVYLSSDPF